MTNDAASTLSPTHDSLMVPAPLPNLGPSCRPLTMIARGGMGCVFLGLRSDEAQRWSTVAIKVMDPLIECSEARAMFADEARLGMQIDHPNVVRVLEAGEADGQPFMVMEYVEGLSWARILRRFGVLGRPLPIPVIARVVYDLLLGLAAVHGAKHPDGTPAGIIHRDVSPQNVLVGTDGRARLVDLGVATYRGRAIATKPGDVRGKLAYLSPEQITRVGLDGRADVFAAGIVLWEALAGRALFLGDSEVDTLIKVLNDPIVPPSTLRESISPELEDVCVRALERDPKRRFSSAMELADALAESTKLATHAEVAALLAEVAAADITRQRAVLARGVQVLEIQALEEAHTVTSSAPSRNDEPTFVVPRAPRRSPWRLTVLLAATLAMLILAVLVRPRPAPVHVTHAVFPAPPPVMRAAPVEAAAKEVVVTTTTIAPAPKISVPTVRIVARAPHRAPKTVAPHLIFAPAIAVEKKPAEFVPSTL